MSVVHLQRDAFLFLAPEVLEQTLLAESYVKLMYFTNQSANTLVARNKANNTDIHMGKLQRRTHSHSKSHEISRPPETHDIKAFLHSTNRKNPSKKCEYLPKAPQRRPCHAMPCTTLPSLFSPTRTYTQLY